MNQTLTIVIPAYNESKRIIKNLGSIDRYIARRQLENLFKVLIVDDGSTDVTKEVVENWINYDSKNKSCFSLISHKPNKGKGYTVKRGFSEVTTDLVMYTDADGACPIEEVEKLIHSIDNGYDVACGSRILKDGNVKVNIGAKRRFIGLIFHMILRVLGLADLKDTQCGFKLFTTSSARKIVEGQKCFGYSFDVEYLFLAKRFGFKIKEVPVNWYHVEGSKVNLLRDSIKMLLEVLKIRFVYKYNY